MLTVHHLKKSFDLQILFENVSFSLNPGEVIGLVGPNGCGKTTLLRILAGLEAPSDGWVTRDERLRIGYLPQGLELDPAETVGQVIGRAAGDAAALEAELSQAAEAFGRNPEDALLERRYDALLQRVEAAESGRMAQILKGLGLEALDPGLAVAALSGGQKTRLALALVLLSEPELLLLDEPTNHLDIAMLEWLEDWLGQSEQGVLLISHDRTFLDNTVTGILEMDPLKHSLRFFAGNYSAYLEQKQAEIERQWAAYEDQQAAVQQMRADIQRVKAQAAHTERQTRSARIGGHEMKGKGVKDHLRSMAVKVAKKAKAREKKLERYEEDPERVERPQGQAHIHLRFQDTPHLGKLVMETEGLSLGYDPARALLLDVNVSVHAGQRIAISGPNGSGKTTLFRTLAGQLPPLEGKLTFSVTARIGYMTQDQSTLDPAATPLDTLLEFFANQTEARSFLASFLFYSDEALKPNRLLSYGQRARLMLAALVAQKCNCLLLDEPINHLDIPSRAQFEEALEQFGGAVLAIVHDRYFIERFAEQVWWVEGGGITIR